MCRCLVLAATLLLFYGCGDTTIAFCSGGDDHCDNFFLKFGDADEQEDQQDPEPQEQPPAVDAVQPTQAQLEAALKVARLTPQPIEAAIANGTMQSLGLDQPALPGLWLIQASLGRLGEPHDNAATTGFLDQNRVWLSAEWLAVPGPATSETHLLRAGLALFADFAAERDPASAAAGRALARGLASAAGERAGPSTTVTMEVPGRIVVAAGRAPARCCTLEALSASAVILCAAPAPRDVVTQPSRERACASAAHWFTTNVALAPGPG